MNKFKYFNYNNKMSYYNITLSSSASTSILPFLLVNGTIYNGPYNTVYNGTFDNTSGLVVDPSPVGAQKGYGMLANSTSSMTTTFYNTYSGSGLRLLLEPNNPLENSSLIIDQASYVTITNPTCSYADTTNSFIYYSPVYITNGPVSYENWPSQYQQSYTLIFPESYELSKGNLRIQSVLVNGLNGEGALTPDNQQKTIVLNNQNIQNFCINDCGYIGPQTSLIIATGTLMIPLYLSGLTTSSTNTILLSVPFSYDIHVVNGTYVWPNGKPTVVIRVSFDRSKLYTHRMLIQGHSNVNQDWSNLNSIGPNPVGVPANGRLIDLRTVNDLLMFNRSSSYSLFTFLYPQTSTSTSPTILNVNYVIPLTATPS